MSDYQRAGKAKANEGAEQRAEEEQIERSEEGLVCPSCNALSPPEAEFCSECGSPLKGPARCPSCGAKTNPGADICAVCGTWLLEGKCKFCYADLATEAEFCSECGNSRGGIPCLRCGTRSIFDFCTRCGIPLTEGARAASEAAANDPEARAVLDAVRESGRLEAELAQVARELLEAPEAGPGRAQPRPKARPAFFSAAHTAEILGTRDVVESAERDRKEREGREAAAEADLQAEEARARSAALKARKDELEKKKHEAEAAANAGMLRFKNKRFATQQDARRFFMAMKPANVTGWLCNFTNTVHYQGPNECDEPRLGGYWYYGETIDVKVTGPS